MGCWKGMVRGGVFGTGSSSVNWLTRPDASKGGLAPCLRGLRSSGDVFGRSLLLMIIWPSRAGEAAPAAWILTGARLALTQKPRTRPFPAPRPVHQTSLYWTF